MKYILRELDDCALVLVRNVKEYPNYDTMVNEVNLYPSAEKSLKLYGRSYFYDVGKWYLLEQRPR